MLKHETLTADLIATFDEASHILSDYYYADHESDYWFCRWRSREYEAGAKMVESLMSGDSFVSHNARKTVDDALAWYHVFFSSVDLRFSA